MAYYNSEKAAFNILCFLASVLLEARETVVKLPKADARLQDGQPSIVFVIPKPSFGPFERMVHKKLMPLV